MQVAASTLSIHIDPYLPVLSSLAPFLFILPAALVLLVLLAALLMRIVERDRLLTASEARYRAIVETRNELIVQVQADGQISYANPVYARYAGAEPDSLTGRDHFAYIHPDDCPAMRSGIRKMAEQASGAVLEARWLMPNGLERWIRWSGQGTQGLLLDSGQVQLIGFDFTENKLVESSLWESRHRYRALFENANDAIFILGLDGAFLSANGRAVEMLGYSPDELTRLTYQDTLAPEEAPKAGQAMAVLLAGEQLPIYEQSFKTKHDTTILVEVNLVLVRDQSDTPLYIQTIVRDISERKRTETALKEQERSLRAILDAAADGIITIDESGMIISFNHAAEVILGYQASEVIRCNVNLIIPEPDGSQHDTYISHYLETGQRRMIGLARETFGLHKDGTLIPIYLSVSEVDLGSHHVFTGIIRDITQQKQAEAAEREQRILAEALRDTAAALNNTLQLEGVLKSILTNVDRVVPHDAANIMLVEDRLTRIVGVRRSGHWIDDSELLEQTFVRDRYRYLSDMDKSHQPILIPKFPPFLDGAPIWIAGMGGSGRQLSGCPDRP